MQGGKALEGTSSKKVDNAASSKLEDYVRIADEDKKGQASLDEHHSHFILVNDSNLPAEFGTVLSPVPVF